MKQFSDFPRVSLGILPTPIYRLPNISEAMGKNIYIKRDDMTGVALGGNKVRKLEFLIARRHGAGLRLYADHRRRTEQPRHADRRML